MIFCKTIYIKVTHTFLVLEFYLKHIDSLKTFRRLDGWFIGLDALWYDVCNTYKNPTSSNDNGISHMNYAILNLIHGLLHYSTHT